MSEPRDPEQPDFSARIFAFGVQLARHQATEPEHCFFCGRLCDDDAELPYCGPACAVDAQRAVI